MPDDIDAEAREVVPKIPNECSDPQCGDSTWDHDCELGGLHDDVELAAKVAAFARRVAARDADRVRHETLRIVGEVLADMLPGWSEIVKAASRRTAYLVQDATQEKEDTDDE